MTDIFDRIELVREALHLSMQAFADSLSVNIGVITNVKYRRVTEPSPVLIRMIESVHSVNPRWLETGEGDMFITGGGETSEIFEAVERIFSGESEYLKATLRVLLSSPPELQRMAEDFLRSVADEAARSKQKE